MQFDVKRYHRFFFKKKNNLENKINKNILNLLRQLFFRIYGTKCFPLLILIYIPVKKLLFINSTCNTMFNTDQETTDKFGRL